jgi:hypothetical protein
MEPVSFIAEGSSNPSYRSGIDLSEFGWKWGERVAPKEG